MILQFKDVTKKYTGQINILNQINFNLAEGEMAFLTGHSGVGKTTFLKLVTKLENPTAGDVIFDGQRINDFNKYKVAALRREVGFILQNPHLLKDRTISDNVALPLLINGTDPATIQRRVSAALDMVGLLHKEKMLPQLLSTGEQQRVGIARAIVHKPKLLLADEPTGNLDPLLSLNIMKLFEQFNEFGMSILIVTHDLQLIANMKHRITVLREGALCEQN
jgi:cell division transport system ATP-binding protein